MVSGILSVLFGSLLVWIGALQIVSSTLPKDMRYEVGKAHGAWIREHILRLPPIKGDNQ